MNDQNENSTPAVDQQPDVTELARLRDMEARLHWKQKHPDYEYDTTETGRKSGESKMPEGYGWMPNNHIFGVNGNCNWERLDYTEIEYWMRLKSDALKDDRSPRTLPEITLPKLKLVEYLQILREHFPKSYMPSATGQVEFTTKPHYVEHKSAIDALSCATGTYVFSPVSLSHLSDEATALPIKEDVIYFGVELQQPPLKIITNLSDPMNETWVCTKRGDGSWSTWEQWYDFTALAINPYVIKELVNVYG